jgi:hypothetical protein
MTRPSERLTRLDATQLHLLSRLLQGRHLACCLQQSVAASLLLPVPVLLLLLHQKGQNHPFFLAGAAAGSAAAAAAGTAAAGSGKGSAAAAASMLFCSFRPRNFLICVQGDTAAASLALAVSPCVPKCLTV